MSATLEIRFISGRAHGTPWGNSHNEGAVEFPPSPWRLLRALVATWFERAPELPEHIVRSLVNKLGSTQPGYRVPPFGGAHTRHYFPESAHKEGFDRATAKVLDAFVALDPERPLVISWNVELTGEERAALATLASLIPYIGRAEALADVQLIDGGIDHDAHGHDRMITAGLAEENTCNPIRLLCPSTDFTWESLLDVPWKLRQQGFAQPPLAQPRSFLADRPLIWDMPSATKQPQREPVRFIQWSLRGKGKVPITAALAYCETLRAAVMRAFKDDGVEPGWEMTGKQGAIRSSRHHEHAHYLPIARGTFLEGLALWVPAGIDERTMRLASSVRRLTNREREGLADFRTVELFLQHVGKDPLPSPETASEPDPFGRSTVWETLTPYAPPRFIRSDTRMMRSLHQQLTRDLNEVHLPSPMRTQIVSGQTHPLEFRRHRMKERLREGRRAVHVRIQFSEPVGGPMSLGALSHFGLGHFRPAANGAATDGPEVVASYLPSADAAPTG